MKIKSPRIVLVDCFDSFTFNLVHRIEFVSGIVPDVIRVDDCSVNKISNYDGIVFSPGPGLPQETFNLLELVKFACENKVVLGVCLGHQAIAQYFGGKLYRQNRAFHGVSRNGIVKEMQPMFHRFHDYFDAGSYHSWAVDKASFPVDLTVSSTDHSGEILSFRHSTKPVWGVQFHPESVLSPQGDLLLENWIELLKANSALKQSTIYCL